MQKLGLKNPFSQPGPPLYNTQHWGGGGGVPKILEGWAPLTFPVHVIIPLKYIIS